MSFASYDNLISSITSEKYFRYDWNKGLPIQGLNNARAVTGSFFDLTLGSGNPSSFSSSTIGTALTWTPCDESSIFSIPHGGNVSPDTKHILNISATLTDPYANPSILTLVDLQGYWANIAANTGSVQTLSGTPGSNLRYANGEGCRLYFTYMGTGQHGAMNTSLDLKRNLSLSYTNQAGTTGRNLPYPVTIQTGERARLGKLLGTGLDLNSSTDMFLPLADDDFGVANVASIQITESFAEAAGFYLLCLARPILTIPLSIGNTNEKDFVNEFISLPRVRDGACLTWIWGNGEAAESVSSMGGSGINSFNIYGNIEFGWG